MTLSLNRCASAVAFSQAALAARSLTVLRPVVRDDVSAAVLALIDTLADHEASSQQTLDAYGEAFERLSNAVVNESRLLPRLGDAWQDYLLDRLLVGYGPFAERATRGALRSIGSSLWEAVRHDLRVLHTLFTLDANAIREGINARLATNDASTGLPALVPWLDLSNRDTTIDEAMTGATLKRRFVESDDWGSLAEALAEHYAHNGTGVFARFRAFRWVRDGGGELAGIAEPDPVRLDQLIGYERERGLLIRNTEHFLANQPANNVLLYGDRGTGKSSSVKALLHAYGSRGLRLIEIHKDDLNDLPLLLRHLRGRPERFIIFIDDLSFDEGETSYKNLKALLEGSLEARPANVLLYATSNRRHLIQERFADRASPDNNEVHAQDTMQEKLSLSDRFGITIIFGSPDQEQYLSIVAGLAAQRNLPIAADELRRSALQWARLQNGRSGRSARQFIDYLTGELALRANEDRAN